MNNNYKDYNRFTFENIQDMNNNYPWLSQPIQIKYTQQNNNKEQKNFILHATGYADLNGRKYIALPSNIIIDSQIKKKYNLI